jgi:FkbM family methyltransferase
MKLDLRNLCQQKSVAPRGVIHVGAYEGKDLKIYENLGVSKALFIEANPEAFKRLEENIADTSIEVKAVNCAISNQNGEVEFYVYSLPKSSSILPLKLYRNIYPNIKETQKLTVAVKTLDKLLEELNISPQEFNLLSLDIQGAELLALQGATNLLKHIEAINTKVCYEELYEGGALIEEIDQFLRKKGFGRQAVAKPYHPSWGDAFYSREGVLTMSGLGKTGDLGNKLFQYGFLQIYASENGFLVETPTWIEQKLFGHNDPHISEQLPPVIEETNNLSAAKFPNSDEVFNNVDIGGEFLYHSKYYAPHKEYFCSLFEPVEEVKNQAEVAWEKLRSRGKTIIGLHLKDTPKEWYQNWLLGLWETLEEPVLFIAKNDGEELSLDEFADYNPVTVKDLEIDLPETENYLDFYLLSKCDIVAIANTPFSFAAALLNRQAKYFFRPHFPTAKLIPFDPWNSEPIFDSVEVSAEPPLNAVAESKLRETEEELNGVKSQLEHSRQELENSQSQLEQTTEELENSQSQRDQILAELEASHTQLQQTREELENSQSQRDQILAELESSTTQLQQTQTELEQTKTQLQQTQEKANNLENQQQQTQTELEQTKTQLQQTQEKANNLESQQQQTQTELDKARSELHDTREELEITQFQLDEVQAELEQSLSQSYGKKEDLESLESQLQQTKEELELTKSKLEQTEAKLRQNPTEGLPGNYAVHIKNMAKILAETIPE